MRKIELDSLRGVAALVVLLFHATAASIPAWFDGADFLPVEGFWNNALMYSPLRIFTAGPEAVWLFFALSGFVLVRSAAIPGYRWDAYYPSRIIRLYVPVIGSVLVTAIVFWLIPHTATPDFARMVEGLPTSYTVDSALADATLLTGTSIANVPLWSLQWEVLFSLLLPVAVLLARRFPWWSLTLGVVASVASVWTGSLFLLYMPMFIIGAVLGYHWEPISGRLTMTSASRFATHIIGVGALALSICLITAGYSLNFAVDRESEVSINAWTTVFTLAKLAGMVLLLAIVMLWAPLRSVLHWKPFVALGTISFSLYLTHGPIVIGLLFLLGPGKSTTLAQIITSLIVAIVFYLAVERNAHRLSRRVASHLRDESPAPQMVGARG
ncbi:acyltransferase [uncultured Microbacterium sp.]|uniref:acyltransferase family protein n=1 Tax=uncultured Microbacterium sp. TaxID=191216 RepID=UPI0028DB3B17|nr:acyltransferase [uncultured Microbacterium sp.]